MARGLRESEIATGNQLPCVSDSSTMVEFRPTAFDSRCFSISLVAPKKSTQYPIIQLQSVSPKPESGIPDFFHTGLANLVPRTVSRSLVQGQTGFFSNRTFYWFQPIRFGSTKLIQKIDGIILQSNPSIVAPLSSHKPKKCHSYKTHQVTLSLSLKRCLHCRT